MNGWTSRIVAASAAITMKPPTVRASRSRHSRSQSSSMSANANVLGYGSVWASE